MLLCQRVPTCCSMPRPHSEHHPRACVAQTPTFDAGDAPTTTPADDDADDTATSITVADADDTATSITVAGDTATSITVTNGDDTAAPITVADTWHSYTPTPKPMLTVLVPTWPKADTTGKTTRRTPSSAQTSSSRPNDQTPSKILDAQRPSQPGPSPSASLVGWHSRPDRGDTDTGDARQPRWMNK